MMIDRMKAMAFAAATFVALASGACKVQPFTISVQEDSEIPADVRAEVEKLDDAFLQQLKADPAAALATFAPDLKDRFPVDQLAALEAKNLANVTFRPVHAALARVHGGGGGTMDLPVKTMPRFVIHWDRITGEAFASFIEGTSPNEDLLLALRWRKAANGWQVRDFLMQPYRVGGKDAAALLDDGEQRAQRGELSAAAFVLAPLHQMLPDGWLEIDGLRSRAAELDKRVDADSARFPILVDALESKPRVWRLEGVILEQRIAARIHYATTLSLDDGDAIKREAHAMLGVLERYLPAVARSTDLFIFTAYGELPTDASKPHRSFGVVIDQRNVAPAPP